MSNLYSLLTIVGPILLGAVLLWAILNNRRTPKQEQQTEEATRRMYDEQNREDKAAEQ